MKIYIASYFRRGAQHSYVAETLTDLRAWVVDREREADECSVFLAWEATKQCDLDELYARSDPLLAHLLETAEECDAALHAQMQRHLIEAAKRRCRAAGRVGRRALMGQSGGCVPVAEAARLFRGPGSGTDPETALKAAREYRLIAVRDDRGELKFPVWQFGPDGGTLPGLGEVLQILKKRPGYSDVFPLVFFLQGNGRTEGRPLDALKAGRTADVIAAAQAALE